MSSFTAQPTSSNTPIVPAAPSAAGASAAGGTAPLKPAAQYRVPEEVTFTNVCKIAITEDKPIMMDYWLSSIEKKALIGVRENNEKLLVKSEEEYTSPIQKIFRAGNEFIIMTENSLYIVDNKIPTKRIT
jgi:hypothetical protein